MNDPHLKQLIQKAVDFITEKTCENEIGLSLSRYFWAGKKIWNPKEAEWDDIGDYHSFIAWYGIEFKDQAALDWVKTQIQIWKKHFQMPNGMMLSLWKEGQPIPRKSPWHIFSFYDQHDALLGLETLDLFTGDELYRDLWANLIQMSKKYVFKYKGFIPNQIILPFHLAHPYCSASSTVGGLIAEELCRWASRMKDEEALDAAEHILKAWIHSPLFQKKHLFAVGYHPYIQQWSPYQETYLMKENTNMIYAFCEFLTHRKDKKIETALNQWFTALQQFKSPIGGYFDTYNLAHDKVLKKRIDKTHNFAVLEAFIEGYKLLKTPKLLEEACELADFWISHIGKTGLIPDYFDPETKQPKRTYAKLDQSADLAIAFLKLAELSGNQKYRDAGEKNIHGLSHFLHDNGWWHRLIDVETGIPPQDHQLEKNDIPGGRNLTKYVGGALKSFLALHKVQQGARFDTDPFLNVLTRDR